MQVYSPIGRTRTIPKAQDDIARARIAFFSCSQLVTRKPWCMLTRVQLTLPYLRFACTCGVADAVSWELRQLLCLCAAGRLLHLM